MFVFGCKSGSNRTGKSVRWVGGFCAHNAVVQLRKAIIRKVRFRSPINGRRPASCNMFDSLTIRQLRGQSNGAGCGGAECAFSIIATMKIELTARVARRRMEFARAMRLGLSSERVDVASGCPTRSASRRPSLATRPT